MTHTFWIVVKDGKFYLDKSHSETKWSDSVAHCHRFASIIDAKDVAKKTGGTVTSRTVEL